MEWHHCLHNISNNYANKNVHLIASWCSQRGIVSWEGRKERLKEVPFCFNDSIVGLFIVKQFDAECWVFPLCHSAPDWVRDRHQRLGSGEGLRQRASKQEVPRSDTYVSVGFHNTRKVSDSTRKSRWSRKSCFALQMIELRCPITGWHSDVSFQNKGTNTDLRSQEPSWRMFCFYRNRGKKLFQLLQSLAEWKIHATSNERFMEQDPELQGHK